jgi:hypothetical protein
MARSRVNRNPSAASAFAVTHQIVRWQRCREQPRTMERIRNRTRAIIPIIVKRAVAAAPNVRPAAQCVRCPDCILHIFRRPRRRISETVAQQRTFTRDHRAVAAPFDLRARFSILLPTVIVLRVRARIEGWGRSSALICHPNWLRPALIPLFVIVDPLRARHSGYDSSLLVVCGPDRRCRGRSQNARCSRNNRHGHRVNH